MSTISVPPPPDPSPEPAPASLFARRRLRVLYLLAVSVATLVLAYRLSDALNPLLIALLLSYVLNPVVRFLERRLRLPRTLAVVGIYVVGASLLLGVGAYSVGKTAVGLNRLFTVVSGGWQIVSGPITRAPEGALAPAQGLAPGPGPGAAPAGVTATGDAAVAGGVATPRSSWISAFTGPAAVTRAARNAALPVYGDGDITINPQAPLLGWLDLNGNGQLDASEPQFSREGGRWRPVPQYERMVRRVPGYLEDIRRWLTENLPAEVDRRVLEGVSERVEMATSALASAGSAVWVWATENLFGGVARLALYVVLVPVYAFFLLRGFDDLVERVRSLLPGLHRDRVELICGRIDRAMASFFRGRLLVMLGKSAVVFVGLSIVGVPFALTIGLVVGGLSIVPGVGQLIGAMLIAILAYGPDGLWLSRALWGGGVLLLAEVAEAVAAPVVLGREVGLHPVTLLVSLFLFGELFGLFGVLLAVPLAAIAKILGQEFILPELLHLAAERPGTQVSGIFPAVRGDER